MTWTNAPVFIHANIHASIPYSCNANARVFRASYPPLHHFHLLTRSTSSPNLNPPLDQVLRLTKSFSLGHMFGVISTVEEGSRGPSRMRESIGRCSSNVMVGPSTLPRISILWSNDNLGKGGTVAAHPTTDLAFVPASGISHVTPFIKRSGALVYL
jgi:hypothetical protein